jgi:hypothetical protein
MADDPPALEQHHCDAGANFVRADRPNKYAQATSSHHHGAVADQSGDLCGHVCAGRGRAFAGPPLSKGNDLKMTKLKEEFFKILPPTIYFFVALHLVMFIRVLMLEGTGLSPYSSASIAVAALVLGKAVLVADMLPLINRFPHKPLIYNIAWKTVIYLLISAVIHYLERLIDFWRQTGGFAAGNQKLLAEIIWPHFWAIQIILFVLIAMYCTMHELVRVIGKEKMVRIFFGPMPAPEV